MVDYSRIRQAQEFLNAKKGVPCADCGQHFAHWIMEFDHVAADKLFNISEATVWLFSHHHPEVRAKRMTQIENELKKCEVVCANCHKNRTHIRGTQGKSNPTKKRARFKPFGTRKDQLKKYGRASRIV